MYFVNLGVKGLNNLQNDANVTSNVQRVSVVLCIAALKVGFCPFFLRFTYRTFKLPKVQIRLGLSVSLYISQSLFIMGIDSTRYEVSDLMTTKQNLS